VEITVRLFAVLREHAGTRELKLDLREGATVADAIGVLRAGALAGLPEQACFVTAVDREYVEEDEPLTAGAELALVPPVSGGAATGQAVRKVGVTGKPLDVEAARLLVGDPRCGATVVFTGTTREVPSLEYEAYEEMAVQTMARLAEEAVRRHGLVAVAVEHRTGTVALGEPSVVVAASAPHRQEAFEGARFLLDQVKANAPIWKREHPEDGPPRWVEGKLPTP
jgi:molybdopterin synthase catalytic subunit/molybdopterin converting factor small subunit